MIMKQKVKNRHPLRDYVDQLQGKGYYTFLRKDALKALKTTDTAFKFAANRLVKKGRIISPRRGFYVIVPTEYKVAGAPPATWFIDELMKFHKAPYYVGLLSAAALHGAAHQQPQEFQIITSIPLRPIRVGREKIRFFTKKQTAHTPIEKKKGATGFFPISTPEATAFDLLRYSSSVGYLGNVATVLNELKAMISSVHLLEIAKAEGEVAYAQRLGFLLDYLGASALTGQLYKWVKRHAPLSVPLVPTRKLTGHPRKDLKWAILINEKVEVDR